MNNTKQKMQTKPKLLKANPIRTPKFIKHSLLVEQDLMTSHEYEQMYYKPRTSTR